MKRLAALSFLLLILFNTLGYYYVLLLLETQERTEAIARISESQNEISGNLLIKMPLSIPYGVNDTEYKRAYGEFVIDGAVYHFVKKKVYNDTLFILCLKDVQASKIKKTITDHSKSYTDQPQNHNSSSKEIIQSPAKFCVGTELITQHLVADATDIVHQTFIFSLYRFHFPGSTFHPPRT